MDYRKFLASALVFSMLAASTGCDSDKGTSSGDVSESESISEVSESSESVEDESSEEETTEELIPPTPVEASDENAVTFDDDDCSFAEIVCDDDYAADGELSVVEVQGNKMLKFTDNSTVELADRVQKVKINAVSLIGAENLDKVRSIEFDVYADATADELVNEDGENVKAPGWIGGGGGTVTAKDDKWYDFSEYGGGEYNFDMSGAVHGQFKFLLAQGGLIWSNEMDDANFLIMRWGLQNQSNLYIDNIVFYDEEGNSIPLAK